MEKLETKVFKMFSKVISLFLSINLSISVINATSTTPTTTSPIITPETFLPSNLTSNPKNEEKTDIGASEINSNGTSVGYQIPGIVIESNRSFACAEIPFEEFTNFELCFFLHLKNISVNTKHNNTIIELRVSDEVLEITYCSSGLFVIKFKGRIRVFLKNLKIIDWTHLCISSTDGEMIHFEINYNWEHEDFFEDKMQFNETGGNSQYYNDSLFMRSSVICVGANDPRKSSIIGAIAGIVLREASENETLPNSKSETCLSLKIDNKTLVDLYLMRTPDIMDGAIKHERYNLRNLCWKTSVFILQQRALNFAEHSLECQSLKGRLILDEEINIYLDKLKVILEKKITDKVDHPKIFNTYTWVHENKDSETAGYCLAYNFNNKTFSHLLCEYELRYNFCMISRYLDYYYYGPLDKYDRHYTLLTKHKSLYLEGEKGSFLKKRGDHWMLYSKFHEKYLTLHNRTVPFGRKTWLSSDGTNEVLTFTNCEKDEFACTNDQCILKKYRCNGEEQCKDGSDEAHCKMFDKNNGYALTEHPPPRSNESVLTLGYGAFISSISNILPDQGIAYVQFYIYFLYSDPRITYKLYSRSKPFECNETWVPILYMVDSDKRPLKFENLGSDCYLHNTKSSNSVSNDDPYMGGSTKGGDLLLDYSATLSVPLPCHFSLRKFPFGTETCALKVSLNSEVNMMNRIIYQLKLEDYFPLMEANVLSYFGKTNLGAFDFLESNHTYDNEEITLSFKLRIVYEYHVVNSFTPSFLICLIAYSTLFFPVNDFNERIMVSLTSLLVLSALLTQSGNMTSRTSNVNYLDIWYVALISFCFLIVIFNMMIHSIEICGEKKKLRVDALLSDDSYDAEQGELTADNFCLQNITKINAFCKIAFVLLFALFFIVFCLGAADII